MEAKPTKIYMTVDTEKINSGNADDCVEFKDNRSNSGPSKDPKSFTSLINAGEKVFWFGEPKDRPQDTIEITNIFKKDEKDPEFLKTKGKDPSGKGAYMAQVIDEYKEGLENYNVIFKIKGKEGDFTVDPKLQMQTTR